MFLTIITKILSFAREVVLSYFYGASAISDAYLISMTIPGIIFSLVGVAINRTYIPIFSNIIKNQNEKEGNIFTNNIINFFIIFCTAMFLIGFLFAEQIVKLFASGFEGESLFLAVNFTKITLFGIYFTTISHILISYLQIKNKFIVPALISVPFNIIIILSIIFSTKNLYLLAVGVVIAIFSQLLVLLFTSFKNGFKYNFLFKPKDENFKKLIYLSLPIILGSSITQINVLVDRTIASRIVVGGISALNYATRLNNFVLGIFVLSITTVMYPSISKMAAENKFKEFKISLVEVIGIINLLLVPITIGSMIFATPIVQLLFGRGAFSDKAIYLTSQGLIFFSVGMVGFGIKDVLTRALYSLQDTKTPMIIASIAITINIILNIILSNFLGIGGLALATSISAIISTILLFICLRRKIGPFGIKRLVISFVKMLIASLIMGIASKMLYNFLLLHFNGNVSLFLAILFGAFLYFLIILFTKVDEFHIVIQGIKTNLKNCKYILKR
jgi:putative peptidoglycan lipid II flippase